mmetsp:Transcript_172/g.361  ORF Transcript_172/g.361 Transcript_172/m.361 type:complete len:198 (-) Transcript_172:150-743(-)|eukprot:CAMPEP_0172608632 /NCGR_PEP_ID=MMETSP1068-20121228/28704_1 /TAXON_ID=35684 /ORGANISM="Pseudopedinella elastica, Strain CCMP716" /LENGTH=197 /DNA_ID=CAMNT_0013411945 /DNA_START=92 /DNA_END=685 /DNA_ORIENTATION=+
MLLNHFRFTLTHLPKAPLRRAPGVLSPFHFSAPVFEEEKKKDGPADLDTSFLTDVYQREDYTEGESSFAGHIAPYRPDNWEEMLERAAASYPPRAGPRRNKEAERQRNRRWVIQKQHKRQKRERIDAHESKQAKIKKELYKMRATYSRFGYGPAMEYAAAVGDASSVGLGGKYGGRLGNSYFGPLFRDGTFDPERAL